MDNPVKDAVIAFQHTKRWKPQPNLSSGQQCHGVHSSHENPVVTEERTGPLERSSFRDVLNRETDTRCRLNITYPMLFKLTNKNSDRMTHCGVLEFVADEGICYLPHWMMQNLLLEEGGLVQVESVNLQVATYSKFQPQSPDFLDITNPKAGVNFCQLRVSLVVPDLAEAWMKAVLASSREVGKLVAQQAPEYEEACGEPAPQQRPCVSNLRALARLLQLLQWKSEKRPWQGHWRNGGKDTLHHGTSCVGAEKVSITLENALRNFACLTTGDVIAINYNEKVSPVHAGRARQEPPAVSIRIRYFLGVSAGIQLILSQFPSLTSPGKGDTGVGESGILTIPKMKKQIDISSATGTGQPIPYNIVVTARSAAVGCVTGVNDVSFVGASRARIYELRVMETKPDKAVSIIECDMNVDFDAPLGYKEPERQAQHEESTEGEADHSGYAGELGFRAFSGSGNRLDGKKKGVEPSPSPIKPGDIKRGIPNYEFKLGKITFIRNSRPLVKKVEEQLELHHPLSPTQKTEALLLEKASQMKLEADSSLSLEKDSRCVKREESPKFDLEVEQQDFVVVCLIRGKKKELSLRAYRQLPPYLFML
ncbi:hypothetical protein P7K49_003040 [Saguinus oedipus]|uniref:Ubiquitin fusion degradation protein 1 homolog n=1 Tax=Saguinus oedipus TaxID=9490 RepID=A0ABQ9WJ12_SAGOE|nr:hypothetical protein P7K49_003040 [Saguinus oedipus]